MLESRPEGGRVKWQNVCGQRELRVGRSPGRSRPPVKTESTELLTALGFLSLHLISNQSGHEVPLV